MPPKKQKFEFTKVPITTNMKSFDNPVQKFRISVKGQNATLNNANEFITNTMTELFSKYKPTSETTKVYRVLYKMSGGFWFSTKPLWANSSPELFHPDLRDEQYNMNHNDELVEHINITMATVPNNKVQTVVNGI
jgi:hypothetical protein